MFLQINKKNNLAVFTVLLFALFIFHSSGVSQTSFDDFRTVAGSYYNLDDGLSSTLTLNNKGLQPLTVNPTVFSLDGTQLNLQPIIVPATNFIDVNLQTMLGNAGNEFRKGSIKLSYFGMQIQLGAQITIKDVAKSISFDEKLVEVGSYNSQWLEGVWYQPSSDAKVKIFLSNTSDQTLNLSARLSRMPKKQGQIKAIELLPHQTKILDLEQDFPDSHQFANHRLLGFSVKQSGAMDALIARVTVSEEDTGYSNVTPLSEAIPTSLPILSQSKSLHGTGLQLEKIGNEKLEPKIAVRNIGTTNTIVKAKIFYTLKNGQKGNVILPNLNLDSLEMRFFDAQNAVDLADSSQIESAGIEITHNGGPGTIISKVESVSATGNHSFRVLLWEPMKTKRAASSYPWNLSGNNQTKVYLKNTTNEEQQYTSYLTYNSGTKYVLGTNKIAPHQVKVIDVKKIRDSQLPDANGNILPLNIEQGQIEWSLAPKINQVIGQTGAEIIGQASQINVVDKTSSVYFCINICVDSSRIEFLDQDVELTIGDSAQLRFVRINTTAYGDNVTYPDPNSYTWISQDNSIAQVYPGTVVANSVGETQINVSGAGATSYEVDNCSQYYSVYSTEWINDPYIIQQLRQTLGCHYCESFSASVDASTNVFIKPKVIIDSFKAVGKNHTANVSVTIDGNTGNLPIMLTLSPNQGTTGGAIFTDTNTATMTITQTTNVEIKGITESSTKNNMRLKAFYNTKQYGNGEDFTVVSVSLTLRTSGNASNDNSGRTEYNNLMTNYNLGQVLVINEAGSPKKWGYGVEIVGNVLPNNYDGFIILKREIINACIYINQQIAAPCLSNQSDVSPIELRDDDPQSGNSAGKIFDLDVPRVSILSLTLNQTRRLRVNFREYAAIDNFVVSDDLNWFGRVSVTNNGSKNGAVINDVATDNAAGTGLTNLTWNLQ